MRGRFQTWTVAGLALAAATAGTWLLSASTAASVPGQKTDFLRWAETPPMGWNSWDAFATTVTEAQTKAQADYMAEHLARFGWQYIVVDIQWYEPNATGFDYRQGAELVMDEWGRLQPAPNRFPSAAGGAGFKALAGYVHTKGLRFGVHLMRGIPRQAVARNTAVKGTSYRAADIANRQSICTWNSDMYGVDMQKPGAQAYYDSVFQLFAEWGVDYVKVDDISRPYHDNEAEIEAIRRAIDRAGRPMVLSLSPGETALSAAAHVKAHANLWRISDDFWDSWPALFEQFARLRNWNPHRGPGHWPDADMLPFGVLDLGRRTSRFTADEQRTVMTLWSIARSPLMHGGDLTRTDEPTLSLLTNPEVLAVNQDSAANRPLFDHDSLIAWTAEVPGSRDKYLALFNARDRISLAEDRAAYRSGLVDRATPTQQVPVETDLAGATKLYLVADGGPDGSTWDHALWVEPRLTGPSGELDLTSHAWVSASAGWGEVSREKAPSGGPMSVGGKTVKGLAAHARSVIEFDVPRGYTHFKATAALDDAALRQPRGATVRFLVYALREDAAAGQPGLPVPVRLSELGFSGPCRVRDLWRRADLEVVTGEFAPTISWHGAGLYRISSIDPSPRP